MTTKKKYIKKLFFSALGTKIKMWQQFREGKKRSDRLDIHTHLYQKRFPEQTELPLKGKIPTQGS